MSQSKDVYCMELFDKFKLPIGRIVSYSKSEYKKLFPNNVVMFNANIVTESLGKIWFGDLDLTESVNSLSAIAKALNEDLYVLSEMDCRFDNENKEFNFYKQRAMHIFKK